MGGTVADRAEVPCGISSCGALPDARITIETTWTFMILGQHLFSYLLKAALGLGIAVPKLFATLATDGRISARTE